jgi:hypothetical protein
MNDHQIRIFESALVRFAVSPWHVQHRNSLAAKGRMTLALRAERVVGKQLDD